MSLFDKLTKPSAEKKELNYTMKSTSNDFKNFLKDIPTLISNHKKKSKSERSTDIKALLITLVIISIIIFAFFKIPFLKKIMFP